MKKKSLVGSLSGLNSELIGLFPCYRSSIDCGSDKKVELQFPPCDEAIRAKFRLIRRVAGKITLKEVELWAVQITTTMDLVKFLIKYERVIIFYNEDAPTPYFSLEIYDGSRE